MKALLFATMLAPFVCYARPREAESEGVSAEKNSRRMSQAGRDHICSFTLTAPCKENHSGDCTLTREWDGSRVWRCISDDHYPYGLRSFISSKKGEEAGCPQLSPPIGTTPRCNFWETRPAETNFISGSCNTVNRTCVAPAANGYPEIIGKCVQWCGVPRVPVREPQQAEKKNCEKNEENDKKKSSKDKA